MPHAFISCTSLFALIVAGPAFALGGDPPPCTATAPPTAVGAWIEVDDDGGDFNYYMPTSPYMALLTNEVYKCVDILSICFINTVPVGPDTVPSTNDVPPATGWTQQFTGGGHNSGTQNPDAPLMPYSNHDYFEWIVRDATAVNPDIKITVTPLYGPANLMLIFDGLDPSEYDDACQNFANNLIKFLDYYGIQGIDIDWESAENPPWFDDMTPEQFTAMFGAIGKAFEAAEANDPSLDYWLTLSPANSMQFDEDCAEVVNCYFDAVNLQLYNRSTWNKHYAGLGVNPVLFAYGACFEDDGQCPPTYAPDAEGAYHDNLANYGYTQFMMWRLNSQNWPTEQAQQKKLYELVYPPAPTGDIDGDGDFDSDDLIAGHAALGTDPADLNFDGCVNGADLGILLAAWSICP